MKKLIYIFYLLFFPLLIEAQQNHWLGNDDNWDDPSKWSLGHVPGASDSVFIDGKGVTLRDAASVAYLSIRNAFVRGKGKLTITGDFEVRGESVDIFYSQVESDSITVGGKFRVNPTRLAFLGTDLLLLGGASVRDAFVSIVQGSALLPLGQVYEVLTEFGGGNLVHSQSTFTNYGTLRFEAINPRMIGSTSYFGAETLYDYGRIETRKVNLLLYSGRALHKNAIIDGDTSMEIGFNRLEVSTHTFDSTNIASGSVFFASDSAIVKNHSSIRADSAGIKTVAQYLTIDSTCFLSIGSLETFYNSKLTKIDKDITVRTYQQNGGTVAGNCNIHVTGEMSWVSGQVGSRFNLIVDGPLNAASVFPMTFNRRKVLMKSGGHWSEIKVKLANGAYIDLPVNQTLTVVTPWYDPESYIMGNDNTNTFFANYGTFVKKGPQVLTIGTTFKNARILTIEEGTMDMNGVFNNLGGVRGNGVLDIRDAEFINNGTFTPHVSSPGLLTILGSYRNNIFLADVKDNRGIGIGHDQLVVSDTMHLAGSTLKLRQTGTATAGSFVIMRCKGGPGCRTGVFANTELPADYSIEYTDTSVIAVKAAGLFAAASAVSIGHSANQEKAVFKILKLTPNTYRVETSGQNDLLEIVSLDGRIIRKVIVKGVATISFEGLARGSYFIQNLNQHKTKKIVLSE